MQYKVEIVSDPNLSVAFIVDVNPIILYVIIPELLDTILNIVDATPIIVDVFLSFWMFFLDYLISFP